MLDTICLNISRGVEEWRRDQRGPIINTRLQSDKVGTRLQSDSQSQAGAARPTCWWRLVVGEVWLGNQLF